MPTRLGIHCQHVPHHVEGARRTTPHPVQVQRSLRDLIARGRVMSIAWRCIEHEDGRHQSLISLGQLASTRAVGVGRQSRSAEEELRLAAANEVGVGYG